MPMRRRMRRRPLSRHLRFAWLPRVTRGFFFRADSYLNLARYVDEDLGSIALYGGKALMQQSHGESFLALVREQVASGMPSRSFCSTSRRAPCRRRGSSNCCDCSTGGTVKSGAGSDHHRDAFP